MPKAVRVAAVLVALALVALTGLKVMGQQNATVDPVFSGILSKLRSSTSVPVLLPASMPELYASYPSLYASISQSVTNTNAYEVLLDDQQNCNHASACAVASFLGEVSSYDSAPLGTTKVTLSKSTQGYFTPGRCGSSCGRSRIDWISGSYRYAVFVGFEHVPLESVKLANSMITGAASVVSSSGAIAMGFSGFSKGVVFYPTYGQEDLGSGEGYPSSLRKYLRIDTVLNSNANKAEWVECGDVNGYVGTSSQNQRWSGHFYAWHTTSGSFGEMIAGTNGASGQNMLYCSDNGSNGWDFGASGSTIATITAISSSATGARVGAYLDGTGSGAIQYRSGTSENGLSNINASGYASWPSNTSVFLSTFPDTSTSAAFDATNGIVSFNEASSSSTASIRGTRRTALGRVLPASFPRVLPMRHPRLESLTTETELRSFAGLQLAPKSAVISVSSKRMDEIEKSSGVVMYDMFPSAKVWEVTVREHRVVKSKFGTLAPGSVIRYFYEAESGRLLGFVGNGQM